MKCISLWQPFATLWVRGLKIHETRGWYTGHRGPLAVHAAMKRDAECREACDYEPFKSSLNCEFDKLPFGAIVGVVDLIACQRTESIYPLEWQDKHHPVLVHPYQERPGMPPLDWYFGDYHAGRFGWNAVHPNEFADPIPYKGSQGFFDIPDFDDIEPYAREPRVKVNPQGDLFGVGGEQS